MLAGIPLDDWQFWVATALAVGAVWLVASPFLPKRRKTGAACPGCPSGDDPAKPARPKQVELTIGGRRVRK